MTRHITTVWGLFFALMFYCATANAAPPVKQGDYEQVKNDLTEYITREMKKNQVVGLSIGLIDDQKLVWAQGFGYADKEKGVPATSQTLYGIMSISKLFTGTAVMQLAEQGKIDIDKPLQTYLPEFSIKTRFPDAGPITPRSMMTHHSGIPSDLAKVYLTNAPPSSVLPILKESYVTAPPDFIWSYSNTAIMVLGLMIEQVSRTDFVTYMGANIFARMGMNKSSFELNPEMRPMLAREYYKSRRSGERKTWGVSPCGGGISNIEDLSKLPMMVFADGMSGSNRILKPETLKEMLTVQNGKVALDFDTRWGLSWAMGDIFGLPKEAGPIAWHDGGGGNFHSVLIVLPEHKLGVIVLTNTTPVIVYDVAGKAIRMMLQAKTGIKIEDTRPAKLSDEVKLPEQELEKLAGIYDSSSGLFEIKHERGRILYDKLDHAVLKPPGIETELVPHKDGELTPRFTLFGSRPVKSNKITRPLFPPIISYLKYREVSGIQGLSANLFGQDLIFDAKLEPTPVPDAWLKRTGRYELIYPYKNTNLIAILNNGKSNLALKNGFLHAELLIFPWSGETIKFALKPVSDTEAVVMGVGRSRGDTISIIKQNNEELICYGGVQYRLIK